MEISRFAPRALTRWIFLLGWSFHLMACSTGASYNLKGQLIDQESKKPIKNYPISATLPLGFGMTYSEVGIGVDILGEKENVQHTTTNQNGKFNFDFETIVHGIHAPPPSYIIKIGEDCNKVYGVIYSKDSFEYRPYNRSIGAFEKVPETAEKELTGQLLKSDNKHHRNTELSILWNEKEACAQTEHAKKVGPPPEPTKNIFYLGYSDVFANSIGVGYMRKLGQTGSFRLDFPIGFKGNSYAAGTFIKWRILPIWRFSASVGFGVEYIHNAHGKALGNGFGLKDPNVTGKWVLGADISINRNLYLEGGYASMTLDQNHHHEHAYLRAGWEF